MLLGENQIFLQKIPDTGIPRVKVNPKEKWIKHVHLDGARFHVLSWLGIGGSFGYKCTAITRCSEPDCIINKIADEQMEEYKKNSFKYFEH